jgi:hypothetical protein
MRIGCRGAGAPLGCLLERHFPDIRSDSSSRKVMSPSTAILDRTRIQDIYRKHGVPWIWSVDPVSRTIEVLRLSVKTLSRLLPFKKPR